MKNIIKLMGLITLIGFSFFYTDKVIEVIREEDEIMIELQNIKDTYHVAPIDATMDESTIIPGLKGRKINIDESYKKMKETGIFNKNLLVYDPIDPKVSLRTNHDKFIVQGNHNKQMISLLFPLTTNKYLENIIEILKMKDVTANFFVDYSYLIDNSTKIKELSNHEFYSYGNNGKYTPDNILFSNNLISRISNNNAIYCLSPKKEKSTLDLCNENNLYTIAPNIVSSTTPYNTIKENLTSGSMILLSPNNETISELSTIIDYIKGKGYKIGALSQLLSEDL